MNIEACERRWIQSWNDGLLPSSAVQFMADTWDPVVPWPETVFCDRLISILSLLDLLLFRTGKDADKEILEPILVAASRSARVIAPLLCQYAPEASTESMLLPNQRPLPYSLASFENVARILYTTVCHGIRRLPMYAAERLLASAAVALPSLLVVASSTVGSQRLCVPAGALYDSLVSWLPATAAIAVMAGSSSILGSRDAAPDSVRAAARLTVALASDVSRTFLHWTRRVSFAIFGFYDLARPAEAVAVLPPPCPCFVLCAVHASRGGGLATAVGRATAKHGSTDTRAPSDTLESALSCKACLVRRAHGTSCLHTPTRVGGGAMAARAAFLSVNGATPHHSGVPSATDAWGLAALGGVASVGDAVEALIQRVRVLAPFAVGAVAEAVTAAGGRDAPTPDDDAPHVMTDDSEAVAAAVSAVTSVLTALDAASTFLCNAAVAALRVPHARAATTRPPVAAVHTPTVSISRLQIAYAAVAAVATVVTPDAVAVAAHLADTPARSVISTASALGARLVMLDRLVTTVAVAMTASPARDVPVFDGTWSDIHRFCAGPDTSGTAAAPPASWCGRTLFGSSDGVVLSPRIGGKFQPVQRLARSPATVLLAAANGAARDLVASARAAPFGVVCDGSAAAAASRDCVSTYARPLADPRGAAGCPAVTAPVGTSASGSICRTRGLLHTHGSSDDDDNNAIRRTVERIDANSGRPDPASTASAAAATDVRRVRAHALPLLPRGVAAAAAMDNSRVSSLVPAEDGARGAISIFEVDAAVASLSADADEVVPPHALAQPFFRHVSTTRLASLSSRSPGAGGCGVWTCLGPVRGIFQDEAADMPRHPVDESAEGSAFQRTSRGVGDPPILDQPPSIPTKGLHLSGPGSRVRRPAVREAALPLGARILVLVLALLDERPNLIRGGGGAVAHHGTVPAPLTLREHIGEYASPDVPSASPQAAVGVATAVLAIAHSVHSAALRLHATPLVGVVMASFATLIGTLADPGTVALAGTSDRSLRGELGKAAATAVTFALLPPFAVNGAPDGALGAQEALPRHIVDLIVSPLLTMANDSGAFVHAATAQWSTPTAAEAVVVNGFATERTSRSVPYPFADLILRPVARMSAATCGQLGLWSASDRDPSRPSARPHAPPPSSQHFSHWAEATGGPLVTFGNAAAVATAIALGVDAGYPSGPDVALCSGVVTAGVGLRPVLMARGSVSSYDLAPPCCADVLKGYQCEPKGAFAEALADLLATSSVARPPWEPAWPTAGGAPTGLQLLQRCRTADSSRRGDVPPGVGAAVLGVGGISTWSVSGRVLASIAPYMEAAVSAAVAPTLRGVRWRVPSAAGLVTSPSGGDVSRYPVSRAVSGYGHAGAPTPTIQPDQATSVPAAVAILLYIASALLLLPTAPGPLVLPFLRAAAVAWLEGDMRSRSAPGMQAFMTRGVGEPATAWAKSRLAELLSRRGGVCALVAHLDDPTGLGAGDALITL